MKTNKSSPNTSDNKITESARLAADDPCPDKATRDGKYTDRGSKPEIATGQSENHAGEEKKKESDAFEQHIATSGTETHTYVSIRSCSHLIKH